MRGDGMVYLSTARRSTPIMLNGNFVAWVRRRTMRLVGDPARGRGRRPLPICSIAMPADNRSYVNAIESVVEASHGLERSDPGRSVRRRKLEVWELGASIRERMSV